MAIRRLAAVTILGVLIGCEALLGPDGMPRPDGGGGGASTSSSSGTGGSICVMDTECADTPMDCKLPKCITGACSFTNEPMGTACSVTNGTICGAVGDCIPASCADGIKSGDETDKDCGGSCSPCPDGGVCKDNSDCLSGVCTGMKCQSPTCSDGVKNGQESDVDCGMACPTKCPLGKGCTMNTDCTVNHCAGLMCALLPTVLLLAAGSNTLAGTLHPPGNWVTTTLPPPSTNGLGVAILPTTGQGVGLMRLTKAGDPQDNNLVFTTWLADSWAPFADVAPSLTTNLDVSLSAGTTTAQTTYRRSDGKYYYAAFTGSAWSPTAEPVGGVAMQSSGNTAAAIAASGDDAEIAYVGTDSNVYVQARVGGVWQPSHGLGGPVSLAPSIIKLTSQDFMVAFVQNGTGKIVYSIGSGTNWTAATQISSATTNDPVSLAALPAGAAALAYRGSTTLVYTSVYKAGQMPPWSAQASVSASTTTTTPAIAAGVAGAAMELVYLANNKVSHTRYINNAWSPAVTVSNASFNRVAIAVTP